MNKTFVSYYLKKKKILFLPTVAETLRNGKKAWGQNFNSVLQILEVIEYF